MGMMMYLLLFAMLIFICVKNFSLLKRYKFNKKYIECYRTVLNNDENVYEYVSDYINSVNKEEYLNKTKVLKLFVEVKNGLDYKETLNSLDLRKIYYDGNKFDRNLVVYNSDTFVFIMMVMIKAYARLELEVIITLNEKIKELTDLVTQLEYQEVLAVGDALLLKNDNGIEILNCLLNGEYTKYRYDKNMIGIYKRIAAAILSFLSQEISDYDKEDLGTFGKSLIGKEVLNDLKIYDKFVKNEEESVNQ